MKNYFIWPEVHEIMDHVPRLVAGSTRLGMTFLRQETTLKGIFQHLSGSASSVNRSVCIAIISAMIKLYH